MNWPNDDLVELDDLQRLIGVWAQEKGWNDKPRTMGDWIALIHSEPSEALEEYRKTGQMDNPAVLEEMADCVIRILHFCDVVHQDLCRHINDKMRRNCERPYRHGDKHL